MQARILPLLGPAAVLYLIADVASASEGLGAAGLAIAALAVVLSLAPLIVRRRTPDDPGAWRVGTLGVVVGVALVGAIVADGVPIAVRVLALLGTSAAAALLLDLALTVPDLPRPLDRGALLRAAPAIVGAATGMLGALAALADVDALAAIVSLPSGWTALPLGYALVAVLLASVLRLLRRRMGSPPEALASNAWAVLGLLAAAAAGGSVVALSAAGVLGLHTATARGLVAFAAASTIAGHVTMVDTRRRLSAGPGARRLVTAAITLVAVTAGLEVLSAQQLLAHVGPGVLGVLVLIAAVVVYRVARPAVRYLASPFGGRLLHAVSQAERRVGQAVHAEDVARAVLGPMRAAAGDVAAEPLLLTADPGRELRIDAAGEPRVRSMPLPEPLAARIADRPGEVIVRGALERLVVRRPELRPLAELLTSLDALCVVPLSVAGEVEGALIIPKGRRRTGITLEEIASLEALSVRLSGSISLLSAQSRAQDRAGRGDVTRKDLEERVEHLEEELDRLRADGRVLKAGRAAERMTEPPVAYGTAMRALMRRLNDIGPVDAPVLLVAEAGTAIDRVGHRIHNRSGRAEGPFVIADCASVRAERASAALFGEAGDDPRPGWLRLATGGALLLVDVPALPVEVQRELAEALAERQARPVAGAGAYPVDVRIIATSRVDLAPLVDAAAFDPELGRWLTGLKVDVPSLRERREDMPSLVLLALDRACRVLGRPQVGIEQEALDVLLDHAWPGNLRELQWAIDTAVARTAGVKVTRADLPGLASTTPRDAADPLDGTYAELEVRVLTHALERTDGNKSEAARYLGLKRTTFLDKLRRLGLTDGGGKSDEESAA